VVLCGGIETPFKSCNDDDDVFKASIGLCVDLKILKIIYFKFSTLIKRCYHSAITTV
jgi:hypothetical protein